MPTSHVDGIATSHILASDFGPSVDHKFLIVVRLWAKRLRNHGSTPGRGKTYLLQGVQTGAGAHLVSYSVGIGYSFSGNKAAEG